MNKITSIRTTSIMNTGEMFESLNGYIYGNVNNGVTTITKIETDSPTSGGIHIAGLKVSDAPSYIVVNGKHYSWVIDHTYSIDGVTYVDHAYVTGLPIKINNIYFKVSAGCKNNPTKDTWTDTFYDTDADKSTLWQNYALSRSEWGNERITPIPSDKVVIDGENSISAYWSDNQGNNFFVGDTYRFTWRLGSRSYSQDVKVTQSDSLDSPDFIIPKEWCDQITGKTPGKLYCTLEYIVDGKSTREWLKELEGDYDDNMWAVFRTEPTATVGDNIIPSISSVTLSDKNGLVPSSWKSFIQFLSNVAITNISASGIYGSTITNASLSVSNNDNVIGSGSGTLSSLPQTATIKEYGTFDVTVTVTDTRGRSASKSAEVTFLSYAAPGINTGVSQRCLKDGTIDNDGTYVMCTASPFYSFCNGHNSYRIYVAYKRTDSATYNAEKQITSFPAVIGSGDFDPEYSYDIQYRIVDQFNTTYFVDYVSTAIMLMHFMREGRGVAFGQKATIQNCMDVSFNALFRQNVGFEVDGKFYTISDIVKHINGLTPQESLDWVENNTKDFSNS